MKGRVGNKAPRDEAGICWLEGSGLGLFNVHNTVDGDGCLLLVRRVFFGVCVRWVGVLSRRKLRPARGCPSVFLEHL